MTEEEARDWLRGRWGSAAMGRLEPLADYVLSEQAHQNLIAPSTRSSIWSRHIADSAQLLLLAGSAPQGLWIDIGSGAGFPGLVVACLDDRPVLLVEPRTRRASFLEVTAGALGLSSRVSVEQKKISQVIGSAAILSARAVASMEDLFQQAHHLAVADTLWLLPKGRSAREEVASVERAWHGLFHVEHSLTDQDAMIVVASKVRRR